MLTRTVRRDMRLGQTPYRKRVVHDLYKRIRIRVEDVSLKPAERSSIIETAQSLAAVHHVNIRVAGRTQSRSLQRQTSSTQFQPSDSIWE